MPDNVDVDAGYHVLAPDSLQARIGLRQRQRMYQLFIELMIADPETTILDVGVTSDRANKGSNYLEAWYPHSNRITALGYADASFLRTEYPGLVFVRGDGLRLPFTDQSFDVVHSSAVIEHVGSLKNQTRLVEESARVASRGFFVTTPYRWFPIEVHTNLPLIHWLPKDRHRAILACMGQQYYCQEKNLNLMDKRDFHTVAKGLKDYDCGIYTVRLGGFPSNLLFVGLRRQS